MPDTPLVWQNWHQTVTQPVRRFDVLRNDDETRSTISGYMATARKVQSLILDAVEQDVSLRAVGGGWSFTRIAATDGIALSTQRLNYRFSLSQGDLVQPNPFPPNCLPVLLQGGISIADVNTFLASRGHALPTSGASNGQTIAGALATGTHGAALGIGAIPEFVSALHIANSPDGRTLWLERASRPVLSQAAATALGVHVVRNDDQFNAALVSFGCFGVVLGVVVEPVPLYWLHAYMDAFDLTLQSTWDAIHALSFAGLALPGLREGGSAPITARRLLVPARV